MHAIAFPEKAGKGGGRQGAESDDHLKSTETAGAIGKGSEFANQRLLDRIEGSFMYSVKNEHEKDDNQTTAENDAQTDSGPEDESHHEQGLAAELVGEFSEGEGK